ncbi:MAG TPA: citrate/2-methylcitrate synthase, partial [Candidatus Limnocylindria bacterium]|nr:citrate/2-methylcitrate synthase [Candidatus Limnocylindria bacterium]
VEVQAESEALKRPKRADSAEGGYAGYGVAEHKPHRPLKTNVEFYAAAVLQGIGLAPSLFPATFALARHAGWTAHALEQGGANRLIRPDVRYIGPGERTLPV